LNVKVVGASRNQKVNMSYISFWTGVCLIIPHTAHTEGVRVQTSIKRLAINLIQNAS
jgi:hypothetical protein